MALIDYKIVKLQRDGRHVIAIVRLYRGAMQDVNERGAQGTTVIVNRYVRIAPIVERTFEYDLLRDMSQEEFMKKAEYFLNKKLIDFASARGHTIISGQEVVTGLEAVSNETVK